ALAINGAKVYITDRRSATLETASQRYAGNIVPVAADIISSPSIKALVSQFSDGEGNRRFFRAGFRLAENISRSDFSNWQDTLATNVAAQYFTSSAFLPLLAQGTKNTPGYSSSIVNIAYISGVMKSSSSGQFAYAASKAAFLQLLRNLATLLSVKVR
ncbi:hypothetical protein FN846DRAFT_757529, partial [Sphaerosporella brunnea]